MLIFQGLGVSMSSSGTTTPRERLDSEDIKVCNNLLYWNFNTFFWFQDSVFDICDAQGDDIEI